MKLVFGLLVVCLLLNLGHSKSCCVENKPWLSEEEHARAKRDISLPKQFMTFVCGKLCASGDGGCFFERICGPYRRKSEQ